MQTIRAIVILSMLALVFALIVVLILSILPHLPMIGAVASWIVVDMLICAGVLIVFGTFFFLRWMWYNSSVVRRGDVVVDYYGGSARLLSAEHEASKIPLQLSAPVTVTEDHRSEEDTVLELHQKGISFKTIATSTGWTEYAVRKLCNTHDGKPV